MATMGSPSVVAVAAPVTRLPVPGRQPILPMFSKPITFGIDFVVLPLQHSTSEKSTLPLEEGARRRYFMFRLRRTA